MARQILLCSCFVIVTLWAFVNAPFWTAGGKQPAQVLAQVSPLTSPLTVTGATTVTENAPTSALPSTTVPANSSPISVVLVALVLLGILGVIGLIIGRRR